MMMENNQETQENESNESSESQVSSPAGTVLNAPKFGVIIPNRVFVGGISSQTTENDLTQLFSSYGNVVNTKIIADRAGVSKGYGFVTFATDEEARRLQNDAESIVLRERRLNIAPAIRKQNYQPRYDGIPMPPVSGSPVQMTSGQMYRQPGVPFFQNGMAFYAPVGVGAPTPQPPQTMTPVQSPVEAPHVYPPGAYGGVAQNTPAPNYTFSCPNPIYYQTPYPYHLALEGYPVSDGTHVAPSNVIIPAAGAESGGVLFAASPYIFAQQPGTQHQQYFDPQNISPMPQAATQEPSPQVFYSPARGFEPTFVYTEVPMSYIPGVRPQYGIQLPINPHFSSPRRGGPAYRGGKYSGRGGKPMKGQPWNYRDATDSAEEGSVLANALTPPITPRSPHDPAEDLPASLQGLNL